MLMREISDMARGWILTLQAVTLSLLLYTFLWTIYLRMKKRISVLVALLFAAGWMVFQTTVAPFWYASKGWTLPALPKAAQGIPVWLWFGVTLLFFGVSVLTLRQMILWRRSHISNNSIKEALDSLPTGICFAEEDGEIRFLNPKMRFLASELTGHAIMDANAFWDTVTTLSQVQRHAGPEPVIELSNGTVWQFSRKQEEDEGRVMWRIRAQDVTSLSYQQRQLEKETKALEAMSARLSEYGRRVTESTREQEILEAKIRIHDDVGHALLATNRSLMTQVSEEEKEDVLALWRRNLVFLRGEETPGEAETKPEGFRDSLGDLETAAEAIGVKILWQGEALPEEETVRSLTETMLHECLTNTVRHAGGDELYVAPMEAARFWIIECSNNGAKPTEAIREGGGLSSLREKVEREGGWLEILWKDGFLLRMAVPKKTDPEEE